MQTAILLAPGFEEIEALATADILRRAGLQVLLAAVTDDQSLNVTGAHHITVACDVLADDLQPETLSAAILPGGLPGATNLAADRTVLALVQHVHDHGHIAAAICAAPIALKAAGLLPGRPYTCYPGFEQEIGDGYTAAPVQTDRNLITGRGPGATPDFAFAILAALGLDAQIPKLKKAMLLE